MKKYIQKKNKNKFYIKGIQVYLKDPLGKFSIENLQRCLSVAINKVPKHLLSNLDIIYIGQFPELNRRKLQALYQDSSVLMTNDYDRPEDMIDDLVHEIAHSIEETHAAKIYFDKKIEKEFLRKRRSMWQILIDNGHDINLSYFLNPDYDQNFDLMLYQDVGYPKLSSLTSTLFYSPYAATSLREYFANGFEAFFMKEDVTRLKSISPEIYKKMIILLDNIGEQ